MNLWQSVMHDVETTPHFQLSSKLSYIIEIADGLLFLLPRMDIPEQVITNMSTVILTAHAVLNSLGDEKHEDSKYHTIELWEVWLLEALLIQGLALLFDTNENQDAVKRQLSQSIKRFTVFSATLLNPDMASIHQNSIIGHKDKLSSLLGNIDKLTVS